VEPFRIAVGDEALEDLAVRLGAARLAPGLVEDGWRYGTSGGYLNELVSYWRDTFDWRAQEGQLNRLAQYRTVVGDTPIHFVWVTGRGQKRLPLLLTHGWPSTFHDFVKVIGPLSDPAAHGGDPDDAFDVIVPSLPGYGFSSPISRADLSFTTTADLFATLLTDVLGYERFVASGSDWGLLVTAQLGHKYADRVAAIHLNGPVRLDSFRVTDDYHPWSDNIRGAEASTDGSQRERYLAWERMRGSHHAVHIGDPQSLAHGMHDSPVGLASWIVRRWYSWSDCHGDIESRFTKNELLTTISLYWFTDTFWSSVRFYAAAVDNPWTASHHRTPVVEVPTAISIQLPGQPPGWDPDRLDLSASYNVASLRLHARGGHFVAMEEPDQYITDLRDFFRPFRR
jgi:pimeloyl-ACP methyl ester carboxylesterase